MEKTLRKLEERFLLWKICDFSFVKMRENGDWLNKKGGLLLGVSVVKEKLSFPFGFVDKK